MRVQDRSREQADDSELADEALTEERVMLTNDTDFLRIAAQHAGKQERFATVFFGPQQQRSIGALVGSIIREVSRLRYPEACSQVFFL